MFLEKKGRRLLSIDSRVYLGWGGRDGTAPVNNRGTVAYIKKPGHKVDLTVIYANCMPIIEDCKM